MKCKFSRAICKYLIQGLNCIFRYFINQKIMIMVKELYHSLLDHAELSMTGHRIVEQVEGAELGLPYVDGLAGMTKSDLQKFDLARHKTLALELTPEVLEADEKRDRKFKAFRAFVEANVYSDDAEISRHAEYLWRIIRRHGASLWSEGLTKESELLNAILNDLKNDGKAEEAIAAIGATAYLNELETAQANFEKLYLDRAKEAAGKIDFKVKETRASLTNNLQALLLNIEVAAALNVEEEMKNKILALIGEVNEVITSIMSNARARIAREKEKEEDE